MNKTIPTPRLRLAPLGEGDKEALIGMLTDERIRATYMAPELDTPEKQTALFIRLRQLSLSDDRFVYGIFLGALPIGMIHEVERKGEGIELGYFIATEQTRRGYASEALSAAIRELFAMGFPRVEAAAFVENPASFRVMQKCGMAPTGETERIEYRGRTHICEYYAIDAPRA